MSNKQSMFPRYDFKNCKNFDCSCTFYQNDEGKYVKFSDIEPLLQSISILPCGHIHWCLLDNGECYNCALQKEVKAAQAELKDVLSDTTYYIRKERVEQLENDLIAAKKSEADCRQIMTTYCEEIDGLNKLIAQQAEALCYVQNLINGVRGEAQEDKQCLNTAWDVIQKSLSSTPTPGAVVPWEVVEEYINAEAWADSFSHCGGCELQKKEAFGRLEIARKKLQSYAPKGNQ